MGRWGNLRCQSLKAGVWPLWRSGTELGKPNKWIGGWRPRADFELAMSFNEGQDLLQHRGLRSAVSVNLWQRTTKVFMCLYGYRPGGQEQKGKWGNAKFYEVKWTSNRSYWFWKGPSPHHHPFYLCFFVLEFNVVVRCTFTVASLNLFTSE